jgi:hypothetical protein
MDNCAIASVEWIFTEQIAPPPNIIKFEGWSLWIDDVKCTCDLAKQNLSKDPLQCYENFSGMTWPFP